MKMFYRELYLVDLLLLHEIERPHSLTACNLADESITCIDRSPIEWLDCYRDMPVYVTKGFDLAIDDCINQDSEDFKDYGQCDRFDETVGSGWWERHRQSLADRQLFAYSKGLVKLGHITGDIAVLRQPGPYMALIEQE